MKIALLTNYLELGQETDSGIGRHVRLLADALAADSHQVHVVLATLDARPARAELERLSPRWSWDIVEARLPSWLETRLAARHRWTIRLLLLYTLLAWKSARLLARRHREQSFDVAETHSYNFLGLFLPWFSRPPVVTRVATTLRQMLPINPVRSRALGWMAALESRVLRQADHLVTHSDRHRDLVATEEHLRAARFAVVPLGMPDPGAPPAPRLPAAGDPIRFFYVGRFETRKGIDVLLAVIPEVAAAFPTAEFTLAGAQGDGSQWAAFREAHPDLARHRVRAPGKVSPEELTGLYRDCDVFVAPSRYESFGLVYIEAMAQAKPVIGCRAGGIPDVITEGRTGLLAEPGDPVSLAACMIRLAGDADARVRMGQAAREEFLQRFSVDALVRNSLRCYRAAAGLPDGGATDPSPGVAL